jgi:hypothetical protein
MVLACLAVLIPAAMGQDKGKTKAKANGPAYRNVEKALSPQVLASLKETGRNIDTGAAPATGVKDLETIAQWLKDLEYTYELKAEEKYILLPEPWINISLSGDGSMLWVTSWRVEMKDQSTVTPDKLISLMQLGGGMAHFFIDNTGTVLGVTASIEAKLATKGALKKRIDTVTATSIEGRRYYSEFK